MSFNLKQFLVSLAALSPIIVAGTAEIASGSSTETKTQLANDSLNLATGVADALLSGDDNDQMLAGLASQITSSVITATSLIHAQQGLPTLAPAATTATPGAVAKQVG